MPLAGPGGSLIAPGPAVMPAVPDPVQVAGAVARYMALREFRARLYGCLTARPDALFELCDAVLCADHAVTSLVQLSLVPQFRRGHGALYDALAAGRIDEEAFAVLLTAALPAVADGDEGRAWVAEHDQIDYGLLEAGAGRCARGPGGAGTGGVRAVAPAAVRGRRHPLPAAGCRVLAGARPCAS